MTTRLGKDAMLVGDDLFVTNVKRIHCGIDLAVANAVLIKVNQIGTLTEAMDAIELAQKKWLQSHYFPSFGRDGRYLYCGSGSRSQCRLDQNRSALSWRAYRKIQSAPSNR